MKKHVLVAPVLLVLGLAAGFAISGCVPVVVTAGATTTGVVAAQERSPGNAMDDAGIKLTLNNLYFNHDINDLFKNVNIHVSEGRVLLTGDVDKPETKVQAVTLAWQANGVREVIDEIQVNNGGGVMNYARDTWIAAQVRSRLLVEKNLRSINYNIEVVNSVVYLIGIAQDQDELDKATYIARTTKYVTKVVSHVVLKDDPRRRAYINKEGPPSGSRQYHSDQPDQNPPDNNAPPHHYPQDDQSMSDGPQPTPGGDSEPQRGYNNGGQPESQPRPDAPPQ